MLHHRRPNATIAGLLLVFGGLLTSTAHAQQSGSFDGSWAVVFTCPATPNGTAGYTRRFPASIRSGVFHGEYGLADQAGSLVLDGSVQPDGSAILSGHGFTGDPGYSAGRPATATPYSFHLQARFSGRRGTGSRVEVRRCDAEFSRQ